MGLFCALFQLLHFVCVSGEHNSQVAKGLQGLHFGICGELGADAELIETFLSMGIDELSVSPSAVLPLRSAIRSIDTTTLAPLEL